MAQDTSVPPTSNAAASSTDSEEGILPPAGPGPAGVVALALNAADAGVTEELREFLHEQQQLASRQNEVAARQSALLDHRIGRAVLEKENIEAQNHHLRLQHIHDMLRLVLDAGLAVFGLGLALLLIWGVWSAVRSNSVLVEPFTVPSSLEAQGLSGTVVAAKFLDSLHKIQQRGSSDPTTSTHLEDAWSREPRIEVPETGLSLNEVRKFLRAWLGHDVRINGALVADGDTLQLTVRGNGVPARVVSGKLSELDSMIATAAERALGEARPVELLAYLESTSRHAEAAALAGPMLAAAPPSEAKRILNMWGNALTGLNRWPEALQLYREASRLDPNYMNPPLNETLALERLGREEEAYRTMAPLQQSTRGTSDDAVRRRAFYSTAMVELTRDGADMRDALADYAHRTGSTHLLFEALITSQDAAALAMMHDAAGAGLALEQAARGASGPYDVLLAHQARSMLAHDIGHDPEALVEARAALYMEGRVPERMLILPPSACLAAREAESAGQLNFAESVLGGAGSFVDCASARAELAARQGKWDEAQRNFAAAVALAPSLPVAYEAWGEALAAHGDPEAAIDKFRAANGRGPHWADPLEHWGEALAAGGNFKAATQKYADASTYAPRWGALHLHWAQALDKLGERKAALQQVRAAQELSLSDADRQLAQQSSQSLNRQ